MNTEHKFAPFVRQWIKDLRSGEFKQGTHMLLDTCRHFCCLGVLGRQVCEEKDLVGEYFLLSNRNYIPHARDRVNTLQLFEEGDNLLGLGKKQDYFSGLNDIDALSFEQIADEVERIAKEQGILE